jgi:hypothetical protein
MSTRLETTRPALCPAGKIQLPSINRGARGIYSIDSSNKLSYSMTSSATLNSTIIDSDLCYNRCPNGEAPQVHAETGEYHCLVPALITYQIKQGTPNTAAIGDASNEVNDAIDFSKSYTVSCQSTDTLDTNTPQTGNTGNIMYGTPILLKSGYYEDPTKPGEVRSTIFSASGNNKWFCRRIMSGSPNISQIQSVFQGVNNAFADKLSNGSRQTCDPSIGNCSSTDKTIKEITNNELNDAANSISNGLQMVIPTTVSHSTNIAVVNQSNGDGVPVLGTGVVNDSNTGQYTSLCTGSACDVPAVSSSFGLLGGRGSAPMSKSSNVASESTLFGVSSSK